MLTLVLCVPGNIIMGEGLLNCKEQIIRLTSCIFILIFALVYTVINSHN